MAVRTDFVAGEVLAAQDLNDTFAAKVDYALPVNAQTGTTYTFVLADGLRLTTASNASASTFTVPPQADVVWLANSVIRLVNFGAGVVTIAGGAGVTVTNAANALAQFESAALIRTASNAWTLVPFSGGASAPPNVEYLVIAGGGGSVVGGAGAGGYRCSVSGESSGGGAGNESPFSITGNTSYTVTIGAGGTAAATNGSDSVFDSITSTGGGRTQLAGNGFSGGSGGGGSTANNDPGTSGGAGTANQGRAGGNSITSTAGNGNGAGGGGAGTAGSNSASSNSGGNGGNGVASTISGTSVTRGGGGGGGGSAAAGSGGSGGGGAGATSGTAGAGVANTGGGAGGGSLNNSFTGAAGGSGVVIIRHFKIFKTANTTGGANVTEQGDHKVYVFNSSGTIEWVA